jgi:hypothetical protein
VGIKAVIFCDCLLLRYWLRRLGIPCITGLLRMLMRSLQRGVVSCPLLTSKRVFWRGGLPRHLIRLFSDEDDMVHPLKNTAAM